MNKRDSLFAAEYGLYSSCYLKYPRGSTWIVWTSGIRKFVASGSSEAEAFANARKIIKGGNS